tara:strand:- start:670 stop:1590 length:921 start_codon:yes stop_codon:yes gene_type:complete
MNENKLSNDRCTVLVLGGSGFIGSATVKQLNGQIEQQYKLKVLSRNAPQENNFGVQYIRGDVKKFENLNSAMKDVDVVIDIVGILRETADQTFDNVHVKGTANIIKACKNNRIKHLIVIGGIRPDPELNDPFTVSKVRSEEIIRDSNLPFTILRSSMVFSRNIQSGVLGRIVRSLEKLKPLCVLPNGGSGTFQPIFIDDLIHCVKFCIEKKDLVIGNTYNIAGLDVWTYKMLVTLVKNATNMRAIDINLKAGFIIPIVSIMSQVFRNPLVTVSEFRQILLDNRVEDNDLREVFGVEYTTLSKEIFE